MTNLTETASWESGIYRLEVTDPVQGGPGGISNVQAQQLANRLAFVKGRFDALTTQVGGTVSNTDQQALVAATVLHAATVAAVRALPVPQVGSGRSSVVITRGGTTEGDGLAGVYRWDSASAVADDGISVITPAAAPATGRWLAIISRPALINAGYLEGQNAAFFRNASNLNAGVAAPARLGSGTPSAATWLRGDGAWTTVDAAALGGAPANAYARLASPALTGTPTAPTAVAGNNSTVLATTAFVQTALTAAKVLAARGYVTLPGGVIIQWGIDLSGDNAWSGAYTFPIAFPNACLSIVATAAENNVSNIDGNAITAGIVSSSQYRIGCSDHARSAYWIAIGW